MAINKPLTVIQMLPALEMGGVEKGTLETSRYLVEQGHRSIVISDGGQMLPTLKQQGGEHLSWPVGEKRLRAFTLIQPVRKLIQDSRADILHLRSRLPAWIGYLAWRGLPAGQRPHLVTTVHGFYSVNVYSAIMTRGESVIAVSESVKDYILKNYPTVAEHKIRVIHRGVSPLHYPYGYRPDAAWLKNWLYPVKGRFIVTMPGRLTAWKGQRDFIQVIEQLKQRGIPVLGLIVGDAHPRRQQFKHELINEVAKRQLENEIAFVGQRTDLKEIMSISHAVLSLSTDPEAFGRTTLEALSLGIPVAGYNHGGVAEQLRYLLPEGCIPLGNTHAMAECLAQWYHTPPSVKRDNPFTLEKMLSETCQIYTQAAQP